MRGGESIPHRHPAAPRTRTHAHAPVLPTVVGVTVGRTAHGARRVLTVRRSAAHGARKKKYAHKNWVGHCGACSSSAGHLRTHCAGAVWFPWHGARLACTVQTRFTQADQLKCFQTVLNSSDGSFVIRQDAERDEELRLVVNHTGEATEFPINVVDSKCVTPYPGGP